MKTIDPNPEAISQGVAEAFDFWLSQHDVSFPYLLEEAITKVFRDWLDENSEMIIERIVERYSRK